MSTKPKILWIGDTPSTDGTPLTDRILDAYEIVTVEPSLHKIDLDTRTHLTGDRARR